MTREEDEREARRRLAEADRLHAEMHPADDTPERDGTSPIGGCGPQCHRVAHLRQSAAVYALLALSDGQVPVDLV